MYLLSKELAKTDKELRSLHKRIEKYIHKYHNASAEDKPKFKRKAEKKTHQYKQLQQERQKLLHKLHEFCAGFARALQEEGHIKI